ncbi:MAG: DUF2490 domain-containing protein [Methylococcaceae bacterium]|nr:DUF2490 domain-containing protein [Methylococcaceae bacterium]
MKKMLISSILFLGITTAANAKTVEDFQTWGNVTATGSLGVVNPELKNMKYWVEGQGRLGNDTSQFSQGIVRGGLGYAVIDKVSVWLGYAFVQTEEPFTKKPFDEHRIWEQLLWSNKFSDITLTSRSRLEQRFIPTGSDVGWRFRQMFKASVPLAYDFSFVVSDEYFVNINKTNFGAADGFDQNRAFAGLGYNFDKNIKTEVGYMNQYIRKAAAPDRKDDILSVNLYLNY